MYKYIIQIWKKNITKKSHKLSSKYALILKHNSHWNFTLKYLIVDIKKLLNSENDCINPITIKLLSNQSNLLLG